MVNDMLGWIAIAASVVIGYIAWGYMKNRPIESAMTEDVDGDLLRLGKTFILHQPAIHTSEEADKTIDPPATNKGPQEKYTIVCFPGFMETMQYFTQLYDQKNVDLIIINNFDYHNPFKNKEIKDLNWKEAIPYAEGTIAYDAAVLNLVIKHLVKTDKIVVHGHSRGGAVTLDAARQNPTDFSHIDILLEAPILPQARLPKSAERIFYYGGQITVPFLIPLAKHLPSSIRQKSPIFVKNSPRKYELLTPMVANPNSADVMFKQIKDILQWPAVTTFDAFNNGRSCTIVMGESDSILSRRKMKKSALQAEAMSLSKSEVNIQIVETQQTDHFISLEQPAQIHSILETIMQRPSTDRPTPVKRIEPS